MAGAVVRGLAPLGVNPLWLVTLHSVMGIAAGVLIAVAGPGTGPGAGPDGPLGGSVGWTVAAGLLLAKAVLDNADGGLARATGQVTKMGRYYDSGMDLVVNVAVFAGLSVHVGVPVAAIALVVSTVALSLDFNMERLYRRPRTSAPSGPPAADLPVGAPEPAYRLFEQLYERLLAPQDRAIERLDRALFRRVEGSEYEDAPLDRRLAWSDLFSTATLVDLGLSTQTVILAACLVAGRPWIFVTALLVIPAWALGVTLLRLIRYRAYRRGDEERPT
ncbi:MAG: CDP-alcohol phosphatidyltransferase family protein [Trueperaceae bacterium]|nr:CDP-alcohol phosphatidyltransferase family protein [Trueperaceae bacterium]